MANKTTTRNSAPTTARKGATVTAQPATDTAKAPAADAPAVKRVGGRKQAPTNAPAAPVAAAQPAKPEKAPKAPTAKELAKELFAMRTANLPTFLECKPGKILTIPRADGETDYAVIMFRLGADGSAPSALACRVFGKDGAYDAKASEAQARILSGVFSKITMEPENAPYGRDSWTNERAVILDWRPLAETHFLSALLASAA